MVAALALILAALGGAPLPAAAVTTAGWADWAPLTGGGGAYSTTVTQTAKGFPDAQMTSTSRAAATIVSGASTWLSQGTAVGARYGSSLNRPYVNLRARADNPLSPSVTTYAFATPTPSSGWTFVLGDIDADQVQVSALDPDGRPLTGAELGHRGSFNYCAPGVVGKPSCTGSATDVPTWDPGTGILLGNASAADTDGASA